DIGATTHRRLPTLLRHPNRHNPARRHHQIACPAPRILPPLRPAASPPMSRWKPRKPPRFQKPKDNMKSLDPMQQPTDVRDTGPTCHFCGASLWAPLELRTHTCTTCVTERTTRP